MSFVVIDILGDGRFPQAGFANLPKTDSYTNIRDATVRLAFALVFVINVQCAVSFVLWPDAYAASFEVAGVPGAAAVQGLGIAFLMWNATYPAVIVSPLRFRAVAVIVLVQQAIGLVGESWLRLGLPAGHAALSASIERFVLFDAAGLVLMAAAFGWLLWVERGASS